MISIVKNKPLKSQSQVKWPVVLRRTFEEEKQRREEAENNVQTLEEEIKTKLEEVRIFTFLTKMSPRHIFCLLFPFRFKFSHGVTHFMICKCCCSIFWGGIKTGQYKIQYIQNIYTLHL